MTKRMLIDATHHEETRVAIVEGERLEEFDYESTYRKALKGSIFLAKVTRVEPSLQAAFVNFGGNRHGFLPFSEIHPDYFRIPISDREALMAEQEEELKQLEEEEEAEDAEEADASDDDITDEDDADEDSDEDEVEELGGGDDIDGVAEDESEDGDDIGNRKPDEPNEEDDVNGNVDAADAKDADGNRGGRGRGRGRGRGGRGRNQRGGRGRGRNAASNSAKVETFGGDDMDDEQRFRFKMRRKYKIQEVIKRGQIMLVQVSKEERGNKGAAVGSYLSLPGRYCVLMPNSPRAGGISRKISNYKDRAKMRELLKDLDVPKGMSVILRTAGVTRTKAEIKRDLEYLMRLWNNIRELTLESSAPALVYEEANLVKRAVRDLYTRDVEEIVIAGDEAYKTAKDFMKMMIPSHVKKVKQFNEGAASLYKKYGIEKQISDIGETTVTLKSGGYLVINPTEALVSIDVNSGKATKERNIEDTALKTNLEAAEEVARQLRLRDLGGLVVIDFIDMEHRGNNGKVERRMRESLAGDRARIQMGRISSFGLMELSRQRLNPSLGESQFETCPHCEGTGRTRTADAAAIMLLRGIEEEAARGRAAQLIVHVSNEVALYMLNQKRQHLSEIEERTGISVLIRVDNDMGAAGFRIEVSKPADKSAQNKAQDNAENSDDEDGRGGRRRGRRGGRRRGGRGRDNNNDDAQDDKSQDDAGDSASADDQSAADDKEAAKDEKPKRGGRRKKAESSDDAQAADETSKDDVKSEDEKKPAKKSTSRSKKKTDDEVKAEGDQAEKSADKTEEKPKDKPKKAASKSKAKAAPAPSNDDGAEAEAAKEEKPMTKSKAKKAEAEPKEGPVAKDYETVNEAPKKKKKGWWSK